MGNKATLQEIDFCFQRGLTPIRPKPASKEPLVHRGDRWDPHVEELGQRFGDSRVNSSMRCCENRALIVRNSEQAFDNFTASQDLPPAEGQDMGVVKLVGMLGVKPRRVGRECTSLCPFHSDGHPNLSVSRREVLQRCFGCPNGSDAQKSLEEQQAR